jgi:hypothetical protein
MLVNVFQSNDWQTIEVPQLDGSSQFLYRAIYPIYPQFRQIWTYILRRIRTLVLVRNQFNGDRLLSLHIALNARYELDI